MENNSPECIARERDPGAELPADLEQIPGEREQFVEEHFTFERVVERWKEVLEEI